MKLHPFRLRGLFRAVVLGLGLFSVALDACAQDARFFRIAGPVPASITRFLPNGAIVWTNTPTNATFIVQTATSLAGAGNWTDYVQIPATNGSSTSQLLDYQPPSGMALIPGGSFAMGDTFSEGWANERPVHTVYVSAFYMDRYDVTKAAWDNVYTWATNHGYSFDNPGLGKAASHPAQTISWYDSVKWCNARSEQAGKTPAYYTDAALSKVYRSGQTNVQNTWVKWNAGYRLPTEAEWEKAARGGPSGLRFPWGNTITWSQANYYADPSDYDYDAYPAMLRFSKGDAVSPRWRSASKRGRGGLGRSLWSAAPCAALTVAGAGEVCSGAGSESAAGRRTPKRYARKGGV